MCVRVILRDDLGAYLNDFLHCKTIDDYAPNGIQVEGRPLINHICTAVTASLDTILNASLMKADALLVHHGYFWKGEQSIITGMKYQRIKALITNDMSLFAYHLPLDCHPEIGNNACLGRLLGIEDVIQHTVGSVANILMSGTFKEPLALDVLSSRLSTQFKQAPLCILGNDKPIRRIAWCSGAAQDYIEDAHRLGADAYISGEISERTYYQAKELGIHYLACGHHATERYGVVALGEHLASHFGLVHHFIDSDNPV